MEAPLAAGATEVMFEGVPTYPDAGRFWKIIQDHKVNVFYTAPTAIRSLIKAGGELPKQYDLSSLRILGTVGEPINPEAWRWYHRTVGKQRCPVMDTWWQTETGMFMITPTPTMPLKPGSGTRPFFGQEAEIVNEQGEPVPAGAPEGDAPARPEYRERGGDRGGDRGRKPGRPHRVPDDRTAGDPRGAPALQGSGPRNRRGEHRPCHQF